MRAVSLAALGDNAYEAWMVGLATKSKEVGLLKVSNEEAERVIKSWER
jgi:hypothetical protein